MVGKLPNSLSELTRGSNVEPIGQIRKFATIDMNTGFVWWVGHADCAADACARSHAETSHTPAEFVECVSRDADAVYAVYEVPEGFDVDDGRSAHAINAAQAYPLVGHFRRSEIDEDVPY